MLEADARFFVYPLPRRRCNGSNVNVQALQIYRYTKARIPVLTTRIFGRARTYRLTFSRGG